MKGRISILIVVAVCLSWGWIGMAGKAEAAIFTDTIEVWGEGGKDAYIITGSGEYTHTFEDENLKTDKYFIENATLSITYGKNTSAAEIWYIDDDNDYEYVIGMLEQNTSVQESNIEEFSLVDDILLQIMDGDPWSLTLYVYEEDNTNMIELYKSELTIECSAVPIPGTALLLFSGLAGLVCFKQTRKK